MDKINIMISSTVKDLLGERKCISDLFSKIEFVNLIGAVPYAETSVPVSSARNTVTMAKSCDLYILILGHEFGFERKDGKSATEIEFDAAYHDDPTKILVFLKEDDSKLDPRQANFIKRVSDYYSGYWRTSFQYTYELQEIVQNSFMLWLKQRASLGSSLTYLDHFIRLAIQIKPEPNAVVYYSVKKDYIDLEYHFFGKVLSIQFNKEQIYHDFWGCLYSLEEQLIP